MSMRTQVFFVLLYLWMELLTSGLIGSGVVRSVRGNAVEQRRSREMQVAVGK